MSDQKTTAALTGWTGDELALIFSARDYIASTRGCTDQTGDCQMPDDCSCLLNAARRVGRDIMNREEAERG